MFPYSFLLGAITCSTKLFDDPATPEGSPSNRDRYTDSTEGVDGRGGAEAGAGEGAGPGLDPAPPRLARNTAKQAEETASALTDAASMTELKALGRDLDHPQKSFLTIKGINPTRAAVFGGRLRRAPCERICFHKNLFDRLAASRTSTRCNGEQFGKQIF